MEFTNFIMENALVLIPALYVIGFILKKTESVVDKYIPVILLPIGVAGAVAVMGLSAESIIQGILVVGATVLTNQVVKQSSKVE
ncbi:phage holin family protein [Clostridium paraputrificum]|uniref:phage holin family protein n=1 Tax=Clostridium paraputrificum TaxID=29363 RepID=UPI00374F2FBF